MSYTPKNKSSAGMTLIEVLISLTITCLLALAVLPLYSKATYINRLSNKKNIAVNAALSKIEELRAAPFANLEDSNFSVSEINGSGVVDISDKDWDGSGTISDAERDLKNIKVTVSWSDEGISKEISIPTIIAKSGVNKQ